jgi:hypothetical protein
MVRISTAGGHFLKNIANFYYFCYYFYQNLSSFQLYGIAFANFFVSPKDFHTDCLLNPIKITD